MSKEPVDPLQNPYEGMAPEQCDSAESDGEAADIQPVALCQSLTSNPGQSGYLL